jgi:hypothetical protein
VFGVTTLTDSVASTSTTTAAVPNSVKTSYDFAATKAKVSVGTAAPVTPSTGDVWVDTAGTATAINAVPLAALTGTGAMIYGASAGTAATLAIGSTDQQLVVSGGVPAWATSPDIAKATLTTTGDIIYASGSATPERLGVGTAGQVLGVAAGVPAWTTPAGGGGLTALGTVTASAGTAISFTSIPTTYKHLLVRWENVYQSASQSLFVRLNGNSGSAYWMRPTTIQGASVFASTAPGVKTSFGFDSDTAVVPRAGTSSSTYDQQSYGWFVVYDYADTSKVRSVQWISVGQTSSTSQVQITSFGAYDATGTAITSFEFFRSSTATINGNFYLYGVS